MSWRFTANDGEDETVDPINFSFARPGQKVIDALFRCTSARYFYRTGDNKIRYLGQGGIIESTRTLPYRLYVYRIAPASESNWIERNLRNWIYWIEFTEIYEVEYTTEIEIEVFTFSDWFLFSIIIVNTI